MLRDNYFQTQSLSVSGALAPSLLDAQERFIALLEKAGRLNRALEFLPSDEEFAERRAAKLGLTRRSARCCSPTPRSRSTTSSSTPTCPTIRSSPPRSSATSPSRCASASGREIHAHPLRREIIATHVTNSMVNRVGSTFVHRMQEETGRRSARRGARLPHRARGASASSSCGAPSRRSTTRCPTACRPR